MIEDLYCQAPCSDCPFRKDSLKGWLGKERIEEIVDAESFVCHKNSSRQCGGFLIFKKKSGLNSEFIFAANFLKIKLHLKNEDIVYSNKEDLIKHHE